MNTLIFRYWGKAGRENTEERMLRVTGKDINCCPSCGKGRMVQLITLKPELYDYIVPRIKKEMCGYPLKAGQAFKTKRLDSLKFRGQKLIIHIKIFENIPA